MDLDDPVCLCFRVSKRKLLNFIRREQPTVPSQMSECGGAGTGCGWCVPILKVLFRTAGEPAGEGEMSAAEYARQRGEYIRATNATVPPGAIPPDASQA